MYVRHSFRREKINPGRLYQPPNDNETRSYPLKNFVYFINSSVLGRLEQTVIRIILPREIRMRLAASKKAGSSIDTPGIYMRVIKYIKSLCNRVTLLKPRPVRHLSLLFQAGHEHNKDRSNLYHDA